MKQVATIKLSELSEMAKNMYGDLVKAVADTEKNIIVVDAELHVDEEQMLLENGSKQRNLWGFNLYPDKFGTENFIEYDSMINIRPSQQNMSRGVENEAIREQIKAMVAKTVQP